jgi:hypothetical protein
MRRAEGNGPAIEVIAGLRNAEENFMRIPLFFRSAWIQDGQR